MKFTITQLPELRVAMATKATKDVRYYLNGICLDLADLPKEPTQDAALEAKIIGTDGRIISVSPITLTEATGVPAGYELLLSIDGTIPKIASRAVIELPDGETQQYHPGTVTLYKENASIPVKVLSVRRIDGTYPDYRRVLVDDTKLESTASMGLNPQYLDKLVKAAGGRTPFVKLSFCGPDNSMRVSLASMPETQITLMPVRL